jgi:hypothetical protein
VKLKRIVPLAVVASLATASLVMVEPASAAPRRTMAQVVCEYFGGTYVDDWGPGAFGCAFDSGEYIVCSGGMCI